MHVIFTRVYYIEACENGIKSSIATSAVDIMTWRKDNLTAVF